MAISQEQLNKIKSGYSNNKVDRIGRISLGNFLAKYAGKSPAFDEFKNRDEVQFTLYWSDINVNDFSNALAMNPQINKQMSKAFFDSLFKYNNKGEQLIYASRRSTLPELVTYDPSSSYMILVDLLHASGTDANTGQPFSRYFTRILNVLPEKTANNEYLTFSDSDIEKITHPTGNASKAIDFKENE